MPRRPRALNADAPYPPGWEPFLAAINADLDDDTTRLVFADWLQENGDEDRAEFIRIQCGLDRGSPRTYRFELSARERELLNQNKDRWTCAFPRWSSGSWRFRRGFISCLSASAWHWLKDGAGIRRQTPVDFLSVHKITSYEHQLFSSSVCVGLKTLALNVSNGVALALADSSALTSLEELLIHLIDPDSRWCSESVTALFGSHRLDKLRELSCFTRVFPCGESLGVTLATNVQLRGLEDLHLRDAGIGPVGFANILTSPFTARLHTLALHGNELGDVGVRSLVGSQLPSLTGLELSFNGLSGDSVQSLANWHGLQTVEWLDLRNNRLTVADAEVILRSPNARALTRARLSVS